eukprot:TRINITY_DN59381_c0_g1_i1.p1 TRINITY_DN59381_c0_g1~~TRINITY_DN59381_c0_g1_i1.p1  ORF type:complete len:363 (+),score=62.95 TRINITY_DN59381_c0_g1_i1:67-1089(+)
MTSQSEAASTLMGGAVLSGGFGGLCLLASRLFNGSSASLEKELEAIRRTETTPINDAVSDAEARGHGKAQYVQLSGELWTDEPLLASDGSKVLAVSREKFEKMQSYHWKKGDIIYEETVTEVHGRRETKKVDTGRRTEGKWVAKVQRNMVEQDARVASTGLCFRQLGEVASTGMLFNSTPSQICIDLAHFDVQDLLRCQKESSSYEPAASTSVNVVVNTGSAEASKQQPPSQVLGYEKTERALPIAKEVFALGNVSMKYAASVGQGGSGGRGSLAILSPAPGKPFIFTFGSRELYEQKKLKELESATTCSKIFASLGYCGLGLGGVALTASLATSALSQK